MKKNKVYYLYYIIAFLIPVAVTLIILYKTSCYPFGDTFTILVGDARDQYVNFFRLLYDRITEGKSFLFSWDTGMGFDFYSNFCYYLSNPCNWIVLLFGKQNIELGMICTILLQNGCCAVTAMYFLMHSKINRMKEEKWNGWLCVLFATAYSMCDYIMAYRFNMMWLFGMAIVPLLMLGIEYLYEKGDGRLYGITLFLGFVANFYFSWFLCIWALLCCVEQNKKTIREWFRSFLKFVIVSVISALCASVILVPSFLNVFSRNSDDWVTISDYGIAMHAAPENFLSGFFWGHDLSMIGEQLFTQNNYCGIFVIILAVLYIFNRNIELRRKVKRISEILILVLALNWIGLYWVLHGLSIPHAYTNRYAFMLVFLLILTAFEGLYKIYEIRFRYIGLAALFLAAMYVFTFTNLDFQQKAASVWVTLLLLCWVLGNIVLFHKRYIGNRFFIINLCVVGLLELMLNPFFSNMGIAYRTSAMAGQTGWMQEYDSLETEMGERKTSFFLEMGKEFAYSQTDIFASAIHSGLLKLYGKLGMYNGFAGGRYTYIGSTPLSVALFNVRYVLTDDPERFGGYQLREAEDTYGLYEAEGLAGFGFILPEASLSWNIDAGNMFEVQNDFTENILGKGKLFTRVGVADIQIDAVACEVVSYTDGQCVYVNKDADSEYYASILFDIAIPQDMDLYFSTESTKEHVCSIYIDEALFYSDDYYSVQDNGQTFHIGELKKGQKVQILYTDISGRQGEGTVSINLYQYHDDIMQKCLAQMQESVYEIDTFEDTYISGTVDTDKGGILYTSIPYYRGFMVYVDGKKTDPVIIGDALLGVRVPAGKHKVEFHYFTYGLKTGMLLSGLGFLLAVIYMIYSRNKNHEHLPGTK